MTAQTALLALVVLRQLDVDRVAVELDFDASLRQLHLDGRLVLIDLRDDLSILCDLWLVFRIVGLSVDLDVNGTIVVLRIQLDAMASGDDLHLLQLSIGVRRFASHDDELRLLGAAVLGQNDPAVGERRAEFRSVEGFDLRATLPAVLASDGALRLAVVIVKIIGHLVGDRLLLVDAAQRLTQRQVLDVDRFFWRLKIDNQQPSETKTSFHSLGQ